jgi:hypothetical protein
MVTFSRSAEVMTVFHFSGSLETRLLSFLLRNNPAQILPQMCLRFKMIHDSAENWTLYADNSGGSDFVKEGFCSDTNLHTTSWFGVYCQYTSSNSAKFYFDDFYVGTVKTDTSYQARARDIIIDEIMADPTPSNGLPESEYVELYNRTSISCGTQWMEL